MIPDDATRGPRGAQDETLDLPAGGSRTEETLAQPSAGPPTRGRGSVEALPAGSADAATVDLGAEATAAFEPKPPGAAGLDPEATRPFLASDPAQAVTLAQTHGGPRPGGGSFHVPPGAGTDGSRFQIVRPHARGGLGEVFVALDRELSREVALKEIQEKHADDPVSRGRFLLEAEVTGGLEHPGIVPVYGLGQYRDGRPYYAMRFIRGESLKEAIDRFHTPPPDGRHDPGERQVAFRNLLRRFIDVCYAMDYAHSRGVIHRDLKPANIMLGPYGETLVVDWGLAKPLDRPTPAGEDGMKPLRPMSASDTGQTLFGSTVGTPHYMSPEQAEGRLDLLGPPSDIYSLGATLYCLLAGTVPFHEKTLGSLLAKVKRGEFPPPRQLNRTVPPAIEAITLKAMALKTGDRYRSARELAQEIEHWLADEPVAAYREPWPARAARWARRHRTAVTTGAALLVTAVVGLSVATVLIDRERARTERQRRLAQANFELAGANFDLARGAVDNMLTELGAVDLVDIPQAEGVRRQMLTRARDFYGAFLAKHGQDPNLRRAAGQAFGRAGDILEMLGDYDKAEQSYDQALSLLRPLAAAGDDEDARRDLARVLHGRGVLLKKALRFRDAEAALKEAVALHRSLSEGDPDDSDDRKALGESLYMLGAVYARQDNRGPDAQKLYDEAIAARKRMIEDARNRPEDRRWLARFLNNAAILTMRANPAAAAGGFQEAAKIQDELIARTPNVPAYRWELGRSRSNLGSIATRDLTQPDNVKRAEQEYDAAITLFAGLAEEYPTVPDYRFELALTHGNRGLLRVAMHREADAEPDLREARRLLKRLADEHPGRPDFRMRLAEINQRIGTLYERTVRREPALEALKQALAEHRELARRHPDAPEYHSALGTTLEHLGRVLAGAEPTADEALRTIEQAADEQRTALKGDANNQAYRRYLHNNLRMLTQLRLQRRNYGAALDTIKAMAALMPEDPKMLALAGRASALCAGKIAADPDLDDSAKADLRARATGEAIRLLREAARRGFREAAELDHPDFNPLRDRPDFRSLRESIRAGTFEA